MKPFVLLRLALERYFMLQQSLFNKGIECPYLGETPEVPVGRPQFPYPMGQTEGSDTGIMNARPDNLTRLEERTELCPVPIGLCQAHERWSFEPSVYLIKGYWKRRGRIIDSRMGDDCDVFMQAGPKNSPGGASLCQFTY